MLRARTRRCGLAGCHRSVDRTPPPCRRQNPRTSFPPPHASGASSLNRSTSRTLRIDNLSAGIRHPLRLLQGPDHAIRSPTDSPPSSHLSGGRLQLESCPPSVGISGRFTLEYASTCSNAIEGPRTRYF